MPFPFNNEQELQQKQRNTTVQGTVAPRVGSGTFTNLQKYLSSNKMAGQQIAGNITSDVTKKVDTATTAQTEADKTGAAIKDQANKVTTASGLAPKIQTYATGTGDLSSEDEGNINYLTQGNYVTDAEKNKTDLAAKSGVVSNALSKVGERSTQLGSESGRYGLLQDIYRKPAYGSGQQRLDQLFLQQAGGNTLGNLQKQTETQLVSGQTALDTTQSTGASNLSNILSSGKTGSEGLTKALTEGFGGITSAQDTEFQKLQDTQNSGLGDLVTGFQTAVNASNGGNINIPKALADKYKALTGKTLTDTGIFDVLNNPNDIGNMFSKANVGLSDVVTTDELARINKLANLGGGVNTKYTSATGDTPKSLVSSGFDAATEKAYNDFLASTQGKTFSTSRSDTAAPYQDPLLQGVAKTDSTYSNIIDLINKEGTTSFNPSSIISQSVYNTPSYSNVGDSPYNFNPTEYDIAAKRTQDTQRQQNAAVLQSQVAEYLKSKGYGRRLTLNDLPVNTDVTNNPDQVSKF